MEMFGRLRRRLTYANVVATVALFVALGGASYAASGALAPGSVGTRQVRKGAITPQKLSFGYQSGVRSRLHEVRLAVVRCSKKPRRCGAPHETLVGRATIALTRPARVMVSVSNTVGNESAAHGATVNLDTEVLGRRGVEPCNDTASVGPDDAEGLSCTGPTNVLRPGKHRLYISEVASAFGLPRIEASDLVVTWWTLPPAERQP